ncbi:MAG: hypothetical protein HRT35_28010, partial [Algicola sp.]|nr:hypothetical protein [Algicola sp.]
AAISKAGGACTNFNGLQVGIHATDEYTRARIDHIDCEPLNCAFQNNDIVIVAGGQAITDSGRLVMLGRNSSDLSAVALAAALCQDNCEIFSDVHGVYTSDPYVVEGAQVMAEVPFELCEAMSKSGAKVLYHRAVEYARRYNVKIRCKSLLPSGEDILGSVIGQGERQSVVVPNAKAKVYQLPSAGDCDSLLQFLEKQQISTVTLEQNHDHYVVVCGDIFDLDGLIASECSSAVSCDAMGMITHIDENGSVEHILVESPQVQSQSQKIHDGYYSQPSPVDVEAKLNKQRSDMGLVFS